MFIPGSNYRGIPKPKTCYFYWLPVYPWLGIATLSPKSWQVSGNRSEESSAHSFLQISLLRWGTGDTAESYGTLVMVGTLLLRSCLSPPGCWHNHSPGAAGEALASCTQPRSNRSVLSYLYQTRFPALLPVFSNIVCTMLPNIAFSWNGTIIS